MNIKQTVENEITNMSAVLCTARQTWVCLTHRRRTVVSYSSCRGRMLPWLVRCSCANQPHNIHTRTAVCQLAAQQHALRATLCSAAVSSLFTRFRPIISKYLKFYQTYIRQIFRFGRTVAVDDQSEISFSIPQGTLPWQQVL